MGVYLLLHCLHKENIFQSYKSSKYLQFDRLAFASQDQGSHPYSAALVRNIGRKREDAQHPTGLQYSDSARILLTP